MQAENEGNKIVKLNAKLRKSKVYVKIINSTKNT